MNQSLDITHQQLQDVLSESNAVTKHAQAIVANYSPLMDEHLQKIQGLALHWIDHAGPKILHEIPQSAIDFYEQFQLTCNNLRHVTDMINENSGGMCEELRYAISDTLYDTLVQTGMHQKTITDLLNLIEKYAIAINESEQFLPATDPVLETLKSQRQCIQRLQLTLQTLLKAWNTTKLKFSTIISDMDGVANYSEHFEQLNLNAELEHWQLLASQMQETGSQFSKQ